MPHKMAPAKHEVILSFTYITKIDTGFPETLW